MADVITRFKIETSQYDSKLRDASKSLSEYANTAKLAGNDFDKFTKSNVEAARAFGNIETGATNAKDKVKELVSAYNDMARAYNSLTKEQQQSDWGKAMAESLQTLKGRISDAKKELYDVGQQGQQTGGIMQRLADKFVINIDAVKLLDIGLKTLNGALGVAKDAFFASEASVDAWGRAMEVGRSLYDGFLTALNTGDISGYLSRIDEIVSAAERAYNELDRLATQKAINNAATQGQRVENERMRTMLRTGRYIAPADGRAATPGLKEGDKLSKQQLATIAKQLGYGQNTLNNFIRADITQAGKAIEALYDQEADKLGLTFSEFRKGTSNMSEFDKRIEGYKQYQAYNKKYGVVDMQGYFHAPKNNPYQQYAAWGVFKDDGERFAKINSLINERAGYQSQLYSNAASNYRAINRASGSGGGSRGGTTRVYEPKTVVLDMGTRPSPLANVDTGWGSLTDREKQLIALKDMVKISGLDVSSIGGNGFMQTEDYKQYKQNEQKAQMKEWLEKNTQQFSTMTSGISSLVSGVQQLGIKVPAGINKMLSVLQGITTILTAIQTIDTIKGWFKSGGIVPHAAGGWVVPGNDTSDRTLIAASSGELILNKAQQGVLAAQLGRRSSALQIGGTPYVLGEKIYLGTNNYLESHGQGQLVTTSMLQRMGIG